MTKIFPLKCDWIWLSTGWDAQQVPRVEMPVWMLSCPSSKMEGKGVKLLKEEPAAILPHTSGNFFPVLPKLLQKKPQEGWTRMRDTQAESTGCALRMSKRNMTLYDFRPTETKQRETKNWYLSSFIQLPDIPKHHQTCYSTTGSIVIMKPPRDWGFLCIWQKQHKTPSSVSISGCATMSHGSSVLKVNLTKFKHGDLLLDMKNSILMPDSVAWFKFSTTGHLLKQLASLLNCPS